MTRVAAIDCGTNSIRLLVAERRGEDWVELDRQLQIVRLGQGVDASGEFHPDALTRTFAAVDAYAETVRAWEVAPERIRFVATSAARDANNSEEFFAGVQGRLGVRPEIISGDEEARLSFEGALAGVGGEEPVLVMDIGGGSTELVLGGRAGVEFARSLDIGSVRITERFWTADPPTPAAVAAATAHIDGLLDASGLDLSRVRTWIGVAGTTTSMAAIHLALPAYDRSRVHGAHLSGEELRALSADFLRSSAETLRQHPSLHPQRADVIAAGSLIASRLSARMPERALLVSESDILDGIARTIGSA
ncbi:MAG: Ppx/GppA phosphatase family protein [Propionibacteriaceae bacterium]